MNQKVLLAWALASTAMALLLLGVLIGTQIDRDGPSAAPVSSRDSGPAGITDPSRTGEPPEQIDSYTVPGELADMPAEWRTQFEAAPYEGYAILFDPERREVIVEQCHHPGYVDERTGAMIETGWEFCVGVLDAALTALEPTSASAVDRRSGAAVELALGLDRQSRPPMLSLAFGVHDMRLVPGSKNDLLQAMERSPEIREQREQSIQMIIARDLAQRRVLEEGGTATDVPTFRLPINTGDEAPREPPVSGPER